MSNTLSNRRETLEDRLAKRRRLRDKKFSDKSSVDESELLSINPNPTATRSLDRQSSKRISQLSNLSSPLTATTSANQHKPSSIENANSKQNYILSNNKINSTPTLPQIEKKDSFESKNEKPYQDKDAVVSANTGKSTPVQQKILENSHSNQDEKPVIIKETVLPVIPPVITETSDPIPQKTQPHQDNKPVIIKETVPPVIPPRTTEKSVPTQQKVHSHHDDKPVIIKETIPPIQARVVHPIMIENLHPHHDQKPVNAKEKISPSLPPIILPRKTEKSNSAELKRLKTCSQTSPDYPSSYPQSSTDHQRNHFNFLSFSTTPITRTKSEQIESINKHRSIDPTFARPDSLALGYLFNKRMVDAELSHTSSSNSKHSRRKTVWD